MKSRNIEVVPEMELLINSGLKVIEPNILNEMREYMGEKDFNTHIKFLEGSK